MHSSHFVLQFANGHSHVQKLSLLHSKVATSNSMEKTYCFYIYMIETFWSFKKSMRKTNIPKTESVVSYNLAKIVGEFSYNPIFFLEKPCIMYQAPNSKDYFNSPAIAASATAATAIAKCLSNVF